MPRKLLRMPRRRVTQSFKKIIYHAGASRVASTNISFGLVTGVDSVAAGQTAPTDDQVPTGSIIPAIEVQLAVANLVSVLFTYGISMQLLRANQSAINPNVAGGNPQRNQIIFQKLLMLGKDQNGNHTFKFKIPKQFQRIREGDSWKFVMNGDQVHSSALQAIYKFYR